MVYWYTGFGLNANTTQPLGINCKLQTAKGLMLDAMLTHIKTCDIVWFPWLVWLVCNIPDQSTTVHMYTFIPTKSCANNIVWSIL